MAIYYGLADKFQLCAFAVKVCDVIGHGSNGLGSTLVLETCGAESLLGEYRDGTLYGAGAGVSQVDEGTFDWLKEKYQNSEIADNIKKVLNIDLSLVSYNELDYSPILALIFCRLRYWVVEYPIPSTREGRAAYWKEHYNSSAGKGSEQKFIERCFDCNVDELIEMVS